MMQAMQVLSPVVGSSLISTAVVQSNRESSCGSSVIRTPRSPRSLTVCQLDSDKINASVVKSSRRNLVIGTSLTLTATTTAAEFIAQPDSAQAAKRKPPPPPEDKKPDEEKFVSGYEAKLLANLKRKEELKLLVEAQKKKAKSVLQPPEENPLDIIGQEVS